MGCDRQHQLRSGRDRLWPACPVLRNRRFFLGGILPGTAKTGICPASLYPLCIGKGGCRPGYGDNDRDLFHLRQRRVRVHEQHRRGRIHDSDAPCRNRGRHRGCGLFAEHTPMACLLPGEPVHNGNVLHPDPHSVRQVFQAVYLHCDFPATLRVLCRGEHRRHR